MYKALKGESVSGDATFGFACSVDCFALLFPLGCGLSVADNPAHKNLAILLLRRYALSLRKDEASRRASARRDRPLAAQNRAVRDFVSGIIFLFLPLAFF